jgi:hypothetical protein
MNERKTTSMLQRLPVILAVTAASYGLQMPVHAGKAAGSSSRVASAKAHGTVPAAQIGQGRAQNA